MSTFSVEYQQKLFSDELHFIDVEDTDDDRQNDQDAWNELRRQFGVHRDDAYIEGRRADINLFGGTTIEYRFIEKVPLWVPGTIEVLAKDEDAAIVEARAALGGDIAIDDVKEIS